MFSNHMELNYKSVTEREIWEIPQLYHAINF